MQNLIDKFVVDAESRNRNDRYWSEKTISKSQCEIAVQDIIGLAEIPNFETDALAKLYFRYSVDYLWVGEFSEPALVWDAVSNKVKKLVTALPWTGRDEDPEESESNLAPAKPRKVKKKTDKERAVGWFKDNLASFEGLKPKDVQARMSQELDILPNSCRGLFYFCKKNVK